MIQQSIQVGGNQENNWFKNQHEYYKNNIERLKY